MCSFYIETELERRETIEKIQKDVKRLFRKVSENREQGNQLKAGLDVLMARTGNGSDCEFPSALARL